MVELSTRLHPIDAMMKPRESLLWPPLSAVAVLLLIVLVPPGSSPATIATTLCSIAPFPGSRDVEATYFVGVGLRDTVPAGPGEVTVSDRDGHWGGGERARIHGQLIAVQRLAGADSARVALALAERGSQHVLVVPWDYDAACRTVPWSRSARFAPADTAGMFTVRLRPADHWVEGIPTFDAFMADLEPYPYGVFFRNGYRGTEALWTEPSLTPEEYFELYRGLPDSAVIRNDPDRAEARVREWVQAHPGLADRYPTPEVLEWVRRSIERSRATSAASAR